MELNDPVRPWNIVMPASGTAMEEEDHVYAVARLGVLKSVDVCSDAAYDVSLMASIRHAGELFGYRGLFGSVACLQIWHLGRGLLLMEDWSTTPILSKEI